MSRHTVQEYARGLHEVVLQMHCQDLFDPPEVPDQWQALKSEQAQLIVDLQDRLDHLAGVTASLDEQR